ncbi:hypothetical protein [Variovorax saccharolyticus]|uniref:hypothetical protein n=1 Tax=Variovorax saccharolyticus TaxID=3053516 RepID=UPI0025765CD1|nr:hypothetical protein [Variovorax sp. J31P216]MDM0029550.1 hypothetical protein [Variovorax sp. J31P216]
MPAPARSAVIGTRSSRDTKARFAALAARRGLTESALLALVIDEVIGSNSDDALPTLGRSAEAGCATERVTLRLRPGDRALADLRAAGRRMRTASYLSMLVRSHVRAAPVMPPGELEELRCAAGLLAALLRQLRTIDTSGEPGLTTIESDLLIDIGRAVESARDVVAAVVRANLQSWEAGHA